VASALGTWLTIVGGALVAAIFAIWGVKKSLILMLVAILFAVVHVIFIALDGSSSRYEVASLVFWGGVNVVAGMGVYTAMENCKAQTDEIVTLSKTSFVWVGVSPGGGILRIVGATLTKRDAVGTVFLLVMDDLVPVSPLCL
jgi:hypothetical protein